jgi:Amt family ammonium transporter
VGAISVHLVCGIWGTLAVGIFSTNPEHSFVTQAIGVAAYGVATVASAFAIFGAVKAVMGLRVSEEEELEGLDYGEHGMHAYDLSLGGGFSPAHGASAMPSPGMATRLATSENG